MSFSSLRSSNILHGDFSSKQCGLNYHRSHHNLAVKVRVFQCPREPLSLVVSIYSRRFGPKCSKCSGSVAKTIYSRRFVPKRSEYSGSVAKTILEETRFSEPRNDYDYGHGGGGDGDSYGGDGGGSGNGGGNGGGGGHDKEGEGEEEEFGPIMKFEEVMKVAEGRGVKLPSDMVEAAKSTGIRKAFLFRYLDLQGSVWPLGFLMKHCAMLRNRMLVDPSFLFKVGTEGVLYGSVGFGCGLIGQGIAIMIMNAKRVFEAEKPGCKFTAKQRVATFFYKGVLYGSVGFGCGLIGQGIANVIMNAKRSIKKSEEVIPVPPLPGSAALCGAFLDVSSNTHHQDINGLERLVETSPLAKQVPPVALAFTVVVRFANNIYGGMRFVRWAKGSGVQ